jgi:bifunctional DNA-binding transcriptional regulator/antitoxin component of YhaV-PrlF toxin-antitoxin module
MRIAIDAVGRLVVPKALRDLLGISGRTELEITAREGLIELSVPDLAARVETRDGRAVIVADEPIAPIDVEDVRAAIDRVRR